MNYVCEKNHWEWHAVEDTIDLLQSSAIHYYYKRGENYEDNSS